MTSLSPDIKQRHRHSPERRSSMAISIDAQRIEMPWTEQHETLLRAWTKDSAKRAKYHDKKRRMFNIVHHAVGIPSMLLPIILGTTEDLMRSDGDTCGHNWLHLSLLIASGVLAGINQFVAPSKKSHVHSEYNAKFSEYITDVNLILCKSKAFRTPADVTLERASNVYNHLCETSPD